MAYMTPAPNPFPTVERLAKECGVDWPHFGEAALRTARIEKIFKEAVESEARSSRVLDTDSSLVLFGSFGRHEMAPESDCDWTKNAKLRLSRKLLYAAGLAFCFRCRLSPAAGGREIDIQSREPFIAAAMEFAATPPLEVLAGFIDSFVCGDKRRLTSTSIFGAYNDWLELLGDKRRRKRLEELSHDSAQKDETFQQVRKIGGQFASGLKVLFFGRDHDENEISNLSLEYVGF